MPSQTVEWVIQGAIWCELRVRDLYVRLAEMSAGAPELAVLWDELKNDEEAHAEALEEILKGLTDEQRVAAASDQVVRSLNEAKAFLSADPLEQIDDGEGALEFAYELENVEMPPLFKLLALEVVPEKAKERLLALQIDEHLHKLDAFRQKHGSGAFRDVALKREPQRK